MGRGSQSAVRRSEEHPKKELRKPHPPVFRGARAQERESEAHITSLGSVTATSLRRVLHTILSKVGFGHERVALTRQGKPVAVLISPEDYAHYRQLEDLLDGLLAKQALKDHESSGGKSVRFDDVCRDLGL